MAAALDLSAPQEVKNKMVAVIDKLCRKWIEQKKKKRNLPCLDKGSRHTSGMQKARTSESCIPNQCNAGVARLCAS